MIKAERLQAMRSCPALDPGLRDDFPMLKQVSHGKPYAYFNNAATALKPTVVLEAMERYYREYGSSVFRGVDAIAERATRQFETVRQKTADFIGSRHTESVVFTSGTTASLNLIARSFGPLVVHEGDEILVTPNEHHANYVPWQELCKKQGAKLVLLDLDENGEVTVPALQRALTPVRDWFCVAHVSNVMGASNDLEALAEVVHKHDDCYLVVDGAQGVVHEQPQVEDWQIDFYAFSAHKLYGPTGLGILYGRPELLQIMPPDNLGGEMIDRVDVYESSYREPPYRFEAGTPPIAEVIGLGAALDYVIHLGYCGMDKRVSGLARRLIKGLEQQDNIIIYNPNNYYSGIVTFNVKGVHPHDAASVYDREGISLRAGHHCSQPTMRWLGVNATLRASIAFYNNEEEIDRLIEISKKAGDFLDVLF